MAEVHKALRPNAYLELGVGRGDLLRLAQCRSVAVDPVLDISALALAGKPAVMLFRQDSQSFFREFDPVTLLGRPVDLAFLDGPRRFEQMLLEFAFAERCCERDSVIVLHDSVPTDRHIARRSEEDPRFQDRSAHPTWWAGDVWKAACLLQRHRPDLRMLAFDTPPTGLIMVTDLDPASTVIEEGYAALIAEGHDTMDEAGAAYDFFAQLDMRAAADYQATEQLAGLFARRP